MADFFKNVGRYFSFFITITLGVLYVFLQRFVPLFRNPVSAIAVVSLVIASLLFVGFTLRAMLGVATV